LSEYNNLKQEISKLKEQSKTKDEQIRHLQKDINQLKRDTNNMKFRHSWRIVGLFLTIYILFFVIMVLIDFLFFTKSPAAINNSSFARIWLSVIFAGIVTYIYKHRKENEI
jgi:hypothetical protein